MAKNLSELTKQTARQLMLVIDPTTAVFGASDNKQMPLLIAALICVLGFALLALLVLVPLAYFTR